MSASIRAYARIRAQIYLLFGHDTPWTHTSRYMVSMTCYSAMSVIMVTMSTDMWIMSTDHVDHKY